MSWQRIVGGGALVLMVAVVAAGAWWPVSSLDQQGLPYSPDIGIWGTDHLGRDVAARVAHGGLRLLVLSALATAVGVGGAVVFGVLPVVFWPRLGAVVMRIIDAFAAIPGILVLLLLAAGFPGDDRVVTVAVGLVCLPFSTRVLRSVARSVAQSGYVEVARARGDRIVTILVQDMAPNVALPLAAEVGMRFTVALQMVATAGFLGLGRGAPWPDWGAMVQANLPGLEMNPWAVLAPAGMVVAVITIVTLATELMLTQQRRAGHD